jgi:hypothetical protein
VLSKGWPGRQHIKIVSPFTKVYGWVKIDLIPWPGVDGVFNDYDLRGKLKPLWTYITKHLKFSEAFHTPELNWGYTNANPHRLWWCYQWKVLGSYLLFRLTIDLKAAPTGPKRYDYHPRCYGE